MTIFKYLLLLPCMMFLSCSESPTIAGSSTHTGNAMIYGKLLRNSGIPPAKGILKLFESNYNPNNTDNANKFLTDSTDDSGYYKFDGLDFNKTYNLIGHDPDSNLWVFVQGISTSNLQRIDYLNKPVIVTIALTQGSTVTDSIKVYFTGTDISGNLSLDIQTKSIIVPKGNYQIVITKSDKIEVTLNFFPVFDSTHININATNDSVKSEVIRVMEDKDIEYDRAFFLDTAYYYNYYGDYFKRSGTYYHLTLPSITRVYLLKYDNTILMHAFQVNRQAYPNYVRIGDGLYRILNEIGNLEPLTDFMINRQLGLIILKDKLTKNDQLLAYFETEDGKHSSDDPKKRYFYSDSINGDSTYINGDIIRPFVLQPINYNKNSDTWILSRKDIYRLNDPGDTSLYFGNNYSISLKIKDNTNNRTNWLDRINILGNDTLLSDYFKWTNNSVPILRDSRIFMFEMGLLSFDPILGPEPFNNQVLLPDSTLRNPKIYQYGSEDHYINNITGLYRIEILYKQ